MTDQLKPGHCHKCGLQLSDNPHPEAGKPAHYLKVGCPRECIPCLTLSRHQWAGRAMKAENEASDLRALLSASKPAAPMGWKLVPVEMNADMLHAMHAPVGSTEQRYKAMLAASPAAPAQLPALIGWWDATEASGFRWKEGVVRGDFSDGTPIYANAAAPAQSVEPVAWRFQWKEKSATRWTDNWATQICKPVPSETDPYDWKVEPLYAAPLPTQPAEGGDLPSLPEPFVTAATGERLFAAHQMRAYAKQATVPSAVVLDDERAAFFDIVFDGPPSHESGRFVEVEDEQRRSFNAGEWIDRGNGLWALRIARAASAMPVGGDERASFETWWMRNVPHDYRSMIPVLMERDANGKYTNPRCEGAWEIWQARAASPQSVATVTGEREAVAEPTHKFAVIRDRSYDGEGLSLWTWNGENYSGADGDCLSPDPDGTLDGYTVEWLTDYQLEKRLNAAAQPAQTERALTYPAEFTDDLQWILGLICFQCIQYAQTLRKAGREIPNKAEAEQAATIDWMLRHYLTDPASWRQAAVAEMRAMADAAQPASGEKA